MRNREFEANKLESFWESNQNLYKKIGMDYNRIVVALEELISQIRLLEGKKATAKRSSKDDLITTFSIPHCFSLYLHNKCGN